MLLSGPCFQFGMGLKYPTNFGGNKGEEMEINVGYERRKDNRHLLKYAIIRIDIADSEYLLVDKDFQERYAETVRTVVKKDIAGSLWQSNIQGG